jgi:hypothetical protein
MRRSRPPPPPPGLNANAAALELLRLAHERARRDVRERDDHVDEGQPDERE